MQLLVHLVLACLLVLVSAIVSPIEDVIKLPKFDSKEPPSTACLPEDGGNPRIRTEIGFANGSQDSAGTIKFSVKYASAIRWAPSTMVSSWNLPFGSLNATSLPLACPQPGLDPSAYTEDCLSMILYVPSSLPPSAVTLMWIHGGSFISGSASEPGLDGSNLAIATNSIVVVVQYRLGALGFLSPDGSTNLAIGDVTNAMRFLQKIVPIFGGSSSNITLAGQSSGATMIRALLATPSASRLFKSAILQSDPMNYGFLSTKAQTALQSTFNDLINCAPTDVACHNVLSLSAILSAQSIVYQQAPSIDPSTGVGEPIRPVFDGKLITAPLDSTAPFPPVSKPLIISTVLDEAALTVYSQFTEALPENSFAPVCNASLGQPRADTIVKSPFYSVRATAAAVDGVVDSRTQLQMLGTDYQWRCSSWTFVRDWVSHGGPAYVGQYEVGASYPGNSAISYCTLPGVVCHQDDIEIVFGTVANATAAQAKLVSEVQARYKAFLYNDNPNANGYTTWNSATPTDVHALRLGGSGEVDAGACIPTFWGSAVQYDYQLFHI